jgi:hypothetical protein
LFDRSSSRRAKIVPAERIVAKEPEASHPAELAN